MYSMYVLYVCMYVEASPSRSLGNHVGGQNARAGKTHGRTKHAAEWTPSRPMNNLAHLDTGVFDGSTLTCGHTRCGGRITSCFACRGLIKSVELTNNGKCIVFAN